MPREAPSTKASISNLTDTNADWVVIQNDRPFTTNTLPVNLLHPILGLAYKLVWDQGRTKAEDNTMALRLASSMRRYKDNEDKRVQQFNTLIREYLRDIEGLELQPASLGGFITDGHVLSNGKLVLLCEAKNEIGSSGAEPYVQSTHYYLEACRASWGSRVRGTVLPAVLVVYFGRSDSPAATSPRLILFL